MSNKTVKERKNSCLARKSGNKNDIGAAQGL
jgi:hypothetical protein